MAEKDPVHRREAPESDFNPRDGFANDPDKASPAVVKVDGEEGDEDCGRRRQAGRRGQAGRVKTNPKARTSRKVKIKPEETVTVTKAQLDRLLAAADKVDGVDSQIRKLFGTTGDLKALVKNLQDATPKGAEGGNPRRRVQGNGRGIS
jgi:hypothetical protein